MNRRGLRPECQRRPTSSRKLDTRIAPVAPTSSVASRPLAPSPPRPLSSPMIRRILTTSVRIAHPVCALAALAFVAGCSRIAPVAGWEFGVPLTVDRSAGLVNRYGEQGTNGTSANHTLCFGAAFEKEGFPFAAATLSPRLSLAISTGRFESESFRVDDPAAAAAISLRSYDVYSTLSVIQLDLPFHFDLGGHVYLGVGPWASWRLSAGYIQTERIDSPATFRYSDGATSRTVNSGDALANEALRAGALLSIGYELVGAEVSIRPEIYGRADAFSLAADLGVRALSAGIALTFMPTPQRPPVPVVAPAAQIDTSQSPRASIDLRLAESASLTSRGTLERLEMPLRPVIPFAEGSAELQSVTTPERAARMSIDSLARIAPEELQRRALDVLGMRMREHPATSITLRGGRAATENPSLAEARARAVREYLESVWSVDGGRMRIESNTATGSEVRIGLDGALAAPIVTRWVTRRYDAPRVGLRHTIDAPSGVRYWEIALRQGDRIVARASEGSGDSVLVADVTLGGGLLPVVGELAIVDSAGARFVARDTLVLREHVRHGAIDRERREVVIMPEESAAERARAIAGTIRDGASVRIVTLAAQGSNVGAATAPGRLAALLLAELERRGVHIDGLDVAAPTERTATALPAGTLDVVVEQPYRERESD